jgi:hypothetical protein
MEEFKTWWHDFADNKLVLLIFAIVGLGVLLWIFASKTSFGKKAIRYLKEGCKKVSDESKKTKEVVEKKLGELDAYKTELDKKYIDFVNKAEEQVSAILIQYQYLKSDLYDVLNVIPNVKVQAKLKELIAKVDNREDEIVKMLDESYKGVEEKVKNTQFYAYETLSKENAELKGEINEIKQIVEELKKVPQTSNLTEEKGETDNGEETEVISANEEVL